MLTMKRFVFRLVILLSILCSLPTLHARDADNGLPLEEVNALTEAFKHIKRSYVNDVSDRDLLRGALKGMMATLDEHSIFMDEEALEMMFRNTSGSYGGIGIEVDIRNDILLIVAPLDGGPADQAGIKAGDQVVKINQTSLKDMPIHKAVTLLKGELGSNVSLTIKRESSKRLLTFELTRQVVEIKSVKSKALDPEYAYVKIALFSSETIEELKSVLIAEWIRNPQLKGLVLDLRNNPGGVLQSAVDVSDLFLNKGLIVETKDRQSKKVSFFAKPGDILKGLPIVILVNGGSASASEIVASALKEHQRATIVGVKTYGKGSVQSIKMVTEATAIKLTTALYYSPKGKTIHGIGLMPDVIIQDTKVAVEDAKNSQSSNMSASDEAVDIQLKKALDIVKGLHVSNNNHFKVL
jgi:carboxyl-terminal processing protease